VRSSCLLFLSFLLLAPALLLPRDHRTVAGWISYEAFEEAPEVLKERLLRLARTPPEERAFAAACWEGDPGWEVRQAFNLALAAALPDYQLGPSAWASQGSPITLRDARLPRCRTTHH